VNQSRGIGSYFTTANCWLTKEHKQKLSLLGPRPNKAVSPLIALTVMKWSELLRDNSASEVTVP